jgi:hypothetical protein
MTVTERRQAANAALRLKIDRIQAGHQMIKTAIEKLDERLIVSARQPGSWPMPDTRRTLNELQNLFKSQTVSLLEAQAHITGDDALEPLISADEMAALMQMQD